VSGDVIALVLGTALAVGALAFVLQPLFFGSGAARPRASRPQKTEDRAVAALREIEFDRVTGKLSDTDYAELRRTYAERAVRELREAAHAGDSAADGLEARIRAYRELRRECPQCGLRPEVDAEYCSHCGTFLDHRCPDCGNAIPQSGAQFCFTCGARLGRRGRPRA
jgi:hypothetical protein